MSSLPIPVSAASPPSHTVHVLGYELYVGPAHATCDKHVLVCFGPGAYIQAVHSVPGPTNTPTRVATPDGASPVALIRLRAASSCVQQSDITLLTPDGTFEVQG